MVRIGNACANEFGTGIGGQPGNQNGKELKIQDWYLHPSGWVVIRAKKDSVREKIAQCMEDACGNMHIGYDQPTNYTLYEAVKYNNFDCKSLTKDVNTDCSSLVRVCVAYAGIPVEWFSTYNEVEKLQATGEFNIITDSKYTTSPNWLLRGDILCTAVQKHTVVVLDDGDGTKGKSVQEVVEPYLWYRDCDFVGMVTKKTNVYTKASKKADILKDYSNLGEGNLIQALGQTLDGQWFYVGIEGKYFGWIPSSVLVDNKTQQKPQCLRNISKPVTISKYVAKVIKDEVIPKTYPADTAPHSMSWNKLGAGNLIDVIGYSQYKKWVFVNIQGAKGWIPLDSIKKC